MSRRIAGVASIPTPRGATVSDLSFSVYLDNDPYLVAGVTISTDALAADVLTFYETELTAAGYRQISETQQNTDSLVTNRLTFAYPDPAPAGATLEIVVRTSDLSPGTSVEVGFTGVAEPHHLDQFRGWATGLPLPEGGDLNEAWMLVSTLIEPSVTLRASYEYAPGVDAPATEASFDAALPVNGWSVDTDVTGDDLPGLTNVDADEIEFGDVSFRETGFEPPYGTLVDVTVTASLTP